MKVKESNDNTLVWFKIIVIFDVLYILLPSLTVWAYELNNYFEDNYAAIVEFNKKELTLFQGTLNISHEDFLILLVIYTIHRILLFFRYGFAKIILPFFILLDLILGVDGILMPMEHNALLGIDNYLKGTFIGFLIYFCYFSSIKNTFKRNSVPEYEKLKK